MISLQVQAEEADVIGMSHNEIIAMLGIAGCTERPLLEKFFREDNPDVVRLLEVADLHYRGKESLKAVTDPASAAVARTDQKRAPRANRPPRPPPG